MALVICPDCEYKHSDQAVSCPQCGRPSQPVPQQKQEKAKKKGGCATGCLVVLGAFILLGAISSGLDKDKKESVAAEMRRNAKSCNEGKADKCELLLKDSSFEDYESITNPKFSTRFKAKRRDAEQASADHASLYLCERALKESLRDPDSLKVLDKDYTNSRILYTATNGFGGRNKIMIDCKTGKNYDQ